MLQFQNSQEFYLVFHYKKQIFQHYEYINPKDKNSEETNIIGKPKMTRISFGFRPFELKYKTKTDVSMPMLKYHGAQDFGRYDYLHDIERIEKISKLDDSFKRGFAIFLTNDNAYLNPGRGESMDEQFGIYQGREISANKSLQWKAEIDYRQERKNSITLKNKYEMKWMKYSEKFHYLISTIEKIAQ